MNQDHLLLLKDSLKYAGSKVIPGLMVLIAVIVFVRMIGTEEYGKYSITYQAAKFWNESQAKFPEEKLHLKNRFQMKEAK